MDNYSVFRKKILLIMPFYFGYDKEIKKRLENIGYKVFLVYENMDEVSLFYRFIYVYLRKVKDRLMNLYYKKKISNLPLDIDIVFVIRGASLTNKTLKILHDRYNKSKYIFYHWDSVKNNSNIIKLMDYFDEVYSFDMEDSKKYGWNYRPLFYINASNEKKCIDMAYISSLHSDRLKVLVKLKKFCADHNLKLYDYLYTKRFHYLKQRYVLHNKDFYSNKSINLKYKPLSLIETNKIMIESRIVVDYTHHDQNGFTMRTCEAIGHRCKLVTNNPMVREADFYNENNIYVYNEDDFIIPEQFFHCSYIQLPENVYERYSLDTWLKDILNYEQV